MNLKLVVQLEVILVGLREYARRAARDDGDSVLVRFGGDKVGLRLSGRHKELTPKACREEGLTQARRRHNVGVACREDAQIRQRRLLKIVLDPSALGDLRVFEDKSKKVEVTRNEVCVVWA